VKGHGKNISNRRRICNKPSFEGIFEKVGYDVMQCFNGGQALDTFQEVQPDLVLLDIMLPEKNGWLILKEISY